MMNFEPKKSDGREKPVGSWGDKRKDGQAATNDSVFDSLADDAWFPALYADSMVDDGFGPDFPAI